MNIRQMLQKYLLISFVFAFPIGQLGSIGVGNNIFVYIHDVILALLLVFSLPEIVKQMPSKQFRPIILLVLIMFISLAAVLTTVVLSEYIRGVLYAFRFLIYSLIPIFVTQSILNKASLRKYVLLAGCTTTAVGFLQLLVFPSLKPLVGAGWDEHMNRMFGTLFDPNFFGMIQVFVFLMSCSMLILSKKNRFLFQFNKWSIAAFFSFVALVLTYSRSAYIAAIIGVFVGAVRFHLIRYVLVFGLLLLGLYFVIPQGSMDTNRITRTISTTARIENWQKSLQYIRERPLLGYGFNTLRFRIAQDLPINQYGIVSRDRSGVDNSILFIFATTGILGGVVYLWWLFQQAQTYISSNDKIFGTAALSSLSAGIIFSFFNNGLFYPWILMWLMMLYGIALKKE